MASDEDPSEVIATTLSVPETRWRDRQPFFLRKGYMLRPRYRPGWKPSWLATGSPSGTAEDAQPLPIRNSQIDATRVADGQQVYIKLIESNSEELRIAQLFSQEDHINDPANHCVPILDVFEDEHDARLSYMVMPMLQRLTQPPFEHVVEIVGMVDQLLEGLVYMHGMGVAHRDCSTNNIMMDAHMLYPYGFHPLVPRLTFDFSRESNRIPRLYSTEPVKYYYIDFGLSVQIPDGQPRSVVGNIGLDHEVPELSNEVPYDPFKTDIFIVGNMLKQSVYEEYSNVGFLRPLIAAMTQTEPSARPDADAALQQWRRIRRRVMTIRYGWRLHDREENIAETLFYDITSLVKLSGRLPTRIKSWLSYRPSVVHQR